MKVLRLSAGVLCFLAIQTFAAPGGSMNSLIADTFFKVSPIFHNSYGNNAAAKGTSAGSRMIASYDGLGTSQGIRNKDSLLYFYATPNSNLVSTSLVFNWLNSVSRYDTTSRNSYTYDAGGNLLSGLLESFAGGWSNNYAFFYSRNAAGQDTSYTEQLWNGSAWVNYRRSLKTYNAQHLLSDCIYQTWNAVTASWDNSAKEAYTYTPANKVSTYEMLSWNTGSGSFVSGAIYRYYYDSNDFLIALRTPTDSTANTSLNPSGLPLVSMRFHVATSWQLSSRLTQTYNASNLVTSALSENWNGTAFLNNYRTGITYNSYDQPTLSFGQSWDGSAWTYASNGSLARYYYAPYATSVITPNHSDPQLTLFPNPAVNNVSICLTNPTAQSFSILVTDATGKIWKRWEATGRSFSEELSTVSMPSGLYFVKVIDGAAGTTAKLVVVH